MKTMMLRKFHWVVMCPCQRHTLSLTLQRKAWRTSKIYSDLRKQYVD